MGKAAPNGLRAWGFGPFRLTMAAVLLALFAQSCASGSVGDLSIVPDAVHSVVTSQLESSIVEVSSSGEDILENIPEEVSSVSVPQIVYRNGREYLKGTIAPCTVDGGSGENPCALGLPTPRSSRFEPSIDGITELNILDIVLPWVDTVGTHLVVRGVVQDKSTRCERYPIIVPNFVASGEMEGFATRWVYIQHYHCFVDFVVSEYIVGDGSPMLTVSVNRYVLYDTDLEKIVEGTSTAEKLLANPRGRIGSEEELWSEPLVWNANEYEGKELVIFLSTPATLAVETWIATAIWFVQKIEDNAIRVVPRFIDYAINDAVKSQLIIPLQELVELTKQAIAERDALTDGRIGADTRLPLAMTDAYDLREFYENAGAVYGAVEGATVLPPPVPGEDDPAPPTIPTDEGIAVSSVPVPGEETTVPPSTDYAGLPDDQVTTTVVSTTTTTEVVATTVVPTSEVDSTVATVPVEPTTTTTTELATTETASTTTTTVVTVAPGGEGGLPGSEDGLPGEEESAPATASSGNNNVPEAENTTLPVENPEEEQQEDGSDPGQEPGDDG